MSRLVTLTLNPAIDQTITVDTLVPGTVHRARAVRSDAGGKGVNVACCLADWGLSVSATGVLGQDNAAPFEARLTAKGIDDRFVWIPGETRTNLKILAADTGTTTDVNLPGLDVTPGTLGSVRAVLTDLAEPGALVVLAGSLPGTLAVDTYAGLLRSLKERGVRTILDASGPAFEAALAGPALPFAVKPNRHEMEEWAGRPLPEMADVAEAARTLVARGIALVVVSLGADGALFVTEEGSLVARPPAMSVQSTVGAGDALVAGLVAGLHQGFALPEVAPLALAFAAGKLMRPASDLPGRDTVRAIAATITVERGP